MSDIDSLNQRVMQHLPTVGSVLIKGSRFMKMERVIEAINACHGHNKKETTPCC
jgi:UDP-N-acetylmuramoyl-tripeptide--D-alanyl-D-alanine ligase